MYEHWDKQQEGWDRFWVDTPFARKEIAEGDQKGALELLGYASTWAKDRDDEYVDPHAFDDTLEPYLRKNPIMLWQHDRHKPVGQIKDAAVDFNGLNVVAWQPPPADREPDWKHLAYHSVRAGIVKTFSIGGYLERELRDKRQIIAKAHLMEISQVSIPSNPDTLFEAAAKALGNGSRRPELTPKHINQMMQLIGLRDLTDPELHAMNAKQRRERFDEIADYYRHCGRRPPEYEEWHELAKETVSSKGLEAVGAGSRVIAFVKRVNGGVPLDVNDEKRGRTISAKHEAKLKQASDLITEVINSVGGTATEEGES